MLIEKTCNHCRQNFSFEYESCGKGSGAVVGRKYCTKECAEKERTLRKSLNMPSRHSKSCIICDKEFFVPTSLLGRKTCSNVCRKASQKGMFLIPRVQVSCANCSKQFETTVKFPQKFCSPVCFSNSRRRRLTKVCEACNQEFSHIKSYKPRFCSKKCTHMGQSMGLVKSHVNGRSGYRTDIGSDLYFKSSFEADYYRYCVQHLGKRPKYEHKTFSVSVNGTHRFYTPDFWFEDDDRFIELKGIQLDDSAFARNINSNTESRIALTETGVHVDVIYMNDFYSSLKANGLYDLIINLEHRDYGKTKHLIIKHSKN